MTDPAKKIAILITGSRDWFNIAAIREQLSLYDNYEEVVVIHGAANGADTIAGRISTDKQWPVFSFPARWAEHGRSAGPIRNQAMLKSLTNYRDAGWETVVKAFPLKSSVGTRDMMRIATKRGFTVDEWEAREDG